MEKELQSIFEEAVTGGDKKALSDLALKYKVLLEMKKAAEKELYLIGCEKNDIQELLLNMMTDMGLSSFSNGKHTFYKTERRFVSINKEKESEAFEWLRNMGYGDLIKETVNAQALSSTLKEVEKDEKLPECLNCYIKNSVGIRKVSN